MKLSILNLLMDTLAFERQVSGYQSQAMPSYSKKKNKRKKEEGFVDVE